MYISLQAAVFFSTIFDSSVFFNVRLQSFAKREISSKFPIDVKQIAIDDIQKQGNESKSKHWRMTVAVFAQVADEVSVERHEDQIYTRTSEYHSE